jgi:hypothetical protein
LIQLRDVSPIPTPGDLVRRFILPIAFAFAAVAPAAGQIPQWVRPGARLRLTIDGEPRPIVATLVRVDGESVSVQPNGRKPMQLASSSLRKLEISREHGTAAGKGLRYGFVAGFSFGALVILADDEVGNKGLGVLAFGGVFGGIGAGLGGLIGSGIPTDQWVPIGPAATSVRPRIGVGAQRVTLGLSISL